MKRSNEKVKRKKRKRKKRPEEEEEQPDFLSEENLESLGYPSSVIQDEEDIEEDN